MFEWKQLFSFQYSFFALLTLLIHLRHKLFIINNKTLMRTLADNALAVRSTHLKGQLASVNRSQISGSGNTVAHSGSAVMRNIQADAYSSAALLQMSVDCGAGSLLHQCAHSGSGKNSQRAAFHSSGNISLGYGYVSGAGKQVRYKFVMLNTLFQ